MSVARFLSSFGKIYSKLGIDNHLYISYYPTLTVPVSKIVAERLN